MDGTYFKQDLNHKLQFGLISPSHSLWMLEDSFCLSERYVINLICAETEQTNRLGLFMFVETIYK